MRRFEEALLNYDLAIKLNPLKATNYHLKATVLDLMNNYEEALYNID